MLYDAELWPRTVFRVRGIPNDVKSFVDTAGLLSLGMGDVSSEDIRVYSLATALLPFEDPRSRVATVMFGTRPSLIFKKKGEDQWRVPVEGRSDIDSLTLDAHFRGMTPLNDVDTIHSFDCIAISGLASHPFGSWQPKGAEKTFMWIRDALPRHVKGARTVIYGYDTKLDCSPSFQRIPDLAQALISQLQTYGWDLLSGNPIAFLAHSLGGLVVKEAMVILDNNVDDAYQGIHSHLKGAVFFGVPNLGMEQEHFRVVVGNNPNGLLIDDIARGSNYLRQLDRSFKQTSLRSHIKCFWAYETSESPTTVVSWPSQCQIDSNRKQKKPDGTTDCQGMPTILVSKESATCGTSMQSMVFPINETHSNMVKFTKDSEYYHIVVSRLNIIFGIQNPPTPNTHNNPGNINQPIADSIGFNDVTAVETSLLATSKAYRNEFQISLEAEVDMFNRQTGLTDAEIAEVQATNFTSLRDFICNIQKEQEQTGRLRNMKRLESFVNSMKSYIEVAQATELFVDVLEAISYLWGPVKYIIHLAQDHLEAFDLVLDAYHLFGREMIVYISFEEFFISTPHMRDVLVMLYKDVLSFHQDAVWHFKQPHWKELFEASWKVFVPTIDHIKGNLVRYRQLIMSEASITEYEAIKSHHQNAANTYKKEMKKYDALRRTTVKTWLCHFDPEEQQASYKKARSICSDPGRWLVNHHLFQAWFDTDSCTEPLLWLNGIPGAGKTILTSVIVDKARGAQRSMVAFFYCKHNDESRNSFLAVARSILAQILSQNPHLLPYFDEKACFCGDVILSSANIAKEMLQMTLKSCGRSYIIIDGLDECPPKERKEILSCFSEITEIRCLFVSQDDKYAGKILKNLPTIKIAAENTKQDLLDFAAEYHNRIENKFGELPPGYDIAKIITARAQGMFIFAEVLAKYLEGQETRSALLEELHPEKLPAKGKLDGLYDRILNQIQTRGDDVNGQLGNYKTMSHQVRLVLGWIVCAKRALKWREIQGAISINLDQQNVDYDRKLLETPKDLFGSLVEREPDGTVKLIHATAREYLTRKDFVQPAEIDYSLSMLSLAYLAFPQVNKSLSDDTITIDLLSGIHAFHDYASACWAIHLEAAIPKADSGDKLSPLLETLEVFIEAHLTSDYKTIPIPDKVNSHLFPMKASEHYDAIAQAVEWSRMQFGPCCENPSQDEVLDLWQVTKNIRLVLEEMHGRRISRSLSEADASKLEQFYGDHCFKCPRVGCNYYHQGFNSASVRDSHVDRHERPFLCAFDGCPTKNFGCSTEAQLRKHYLEWHGIDISDDNQLAKFPKLPKPQKPNTGKNSSNFQCHLCDKRFTAKHNLKNHLNTHTGTKNFACSVCERKFTNKSDCSRHEKIHGDKKFMCLGELKDTPHKWGCGKAFGRADKLADHLKTKVGQKCVRPLLLQNLQNSQEASGSVLSNESGTNSDALLATSKLLPSYTEFCQMSGIDVSALTTKETE